MQKEPPIKCFVTVFSSVAMQREMHRPIYGFIINFFCELLLAGEVQRACALTLNFLFRDCSHGVVKSYKVVLEFHTSLQQRRRF